MDILIYGGGAVGLGIGSCLIKSGSHVTILCRPNAKTLLDSQGLFRNGIFGEFHAESGSFHVITSLDEISQTRFDYIIVCTKSFDTKNAGADIKRHLCILKEDGKVVLFQNGWGNAEIMAEYVSKRIVYSARVITGFVREESHRVRITVHADAIHIGSLFSGTQCEEIRDLCRAISAGGIDCFNTRDIGKDLWAKMLYNCALNPLGAIFSVPYGTLSENEESRDLMNAIIGEIFRVMEKHGFTTHWNTPDDYCRAFYKDLVRLTAAHESSMLQDIRAGRRTEIDAMNGEVVRLAASSDVHTPVNLTVTKMIRFIETRNRIQR